MEKSGNNYLWTKDHNINISNDNLDKSNRLFEITIKAIIPDDILDYKFLDNITPEDNENNSLTSLKKDACTIIGKKALNVITKYNKIFKYFI